MGFNSGLKGLNLPYKRRKTKDWQSDRRSAGPALIGRAGDENTPYTVTYNRLMLQIDQAY